MLVNDRNEEIIAILKSLGSNYPIIREFGCEPTRLLVLIVKAGQLKPVMDYLSDAHTPKLDAFMSIKQVAGILTSNASAFAVYSYAPSKNSNGFIMGLADIVRGGKIMGKTITTIPLVVAEEEIILFLDTYNFFTVYWDGCVETLALKQDDIIPDDDQVPVVWDKLKTVLNLEQTAEEKAMLAAACFLYPELSESYPNVQFDSYLRTVEEMIRQDDDNKDANHLSDMFLQELYRWQEKMAFSDIFELPNLDMKTLERLEQIILYDSDYIYMKQDLLKKIAGNLLAVFSTSVLKSQLFEAGILCADRSKTYTIKVTYFDIAGQFHRERLLRFARCKINIVGELDFVEACLDRKERHNAEYRNVQG